MSNHEIPVVEVNLEAHPNADNLAIVRPIGAFTVCTRWDDWRPGQFGAYIAPDYLVPDDPTFAFLCTHSLPEDTSKPGSYSSWTWVCRKCRRIRARKLRGVWSQGLLLPAPAGAAVGDNVMEQMGITRYEPPVSGDSTGLGYSDAEAPPPGINHIYDVENWFRYPTKFNEGESLVVTEKIHGTNSRYTFREDRMFVGTRRRWIKDDARSGWWNVLRKYPEIERVCRAYPGATLYGEIYGMQDLRYNVPRGDWMFVAFDLQLETGRFAEYDLFAEIMRVFDVPRVPELAAFEYTGQDSNVLLQSLSIGDSELAPGQIKEGIVVRPASAERWDPEVGRVILKLVSNDYLMRTK